VGVKAAAAAAADSCRFPNAACSDCSVATAVAAGEERKAQSLKRAEES
jgi:hypothetical protein